MLTGSLKVPRLIIPTPLRHVSPPPPPPHEAAVLEDFVTVMLELLPQAPPSPMRHMRVLDPEFAVTTVRRQPAGTRIAYVEPRPARGFLGLVEPRRGCHGHVETN